MPSGPSGVGPIHKDATRHTRNKATRPSHICFCHSAATGQSLIAALEEKRGFTPDGTPPHPTPPLTVSVCGLREEQQSTPILFTTCSQICGISHNIKSPQTERILVLLLHQCPPTPIQAVLQRKLSPVDVETRPDARWNQPVQPQTLAHFQSIGSTEVELPHTRRTCVTQHGPGGECRSGCAYCFFTPERKCNLSSFAVACMFDRFSPEASPRQSGQLHHQLRFPRKHHQKEKTSKQGLNLLLVKQRRKGSRPNTLP